jgi:hypothetical protein
MLVSTLAYDLDYPVLLGLLVENTLVVYTYVSHEYLPKFHDALWPHNYSTPYTRIFNQTSTCITSTCITSTCITTAFIQNINSETSRVTTQLLHQNSQVTLPIIFSFKD